MQEAAEAMRRAASGTPNASSQGGAALERLRGATQKLENARSSGANQGSRTSQRRAEELGERQKEIAQGVRELPGPAGADRAERMRRLGERKDGLPPTCSAWRPTRERLARETRRDQPDAARKLSEAAGAVRDTRLRDKIAYSKASCANAAEATGISKG